VQGIAGPGVELISRVGNKVSGFPFAAAPPRPQVSSPGEEAGLKRAIFTGYPISPSPMTMAATRNPETWP